MDSQRWDRINEIFDEAHELPVGDRTAFVRERCNGDEELAVEVLSLLREGDSMHSLLDGVALDAAGLAGELSREGRRVGPYLLKEQLGVGGMGEVYLAERADGQFEHQVALKLVRGATQTGQILRRFKTERQILARLQHPNIARLLDGGLTELGEPYFVLEYVEGRPIDVFANENELDVNARLRLFDQVVHAVTYAHANLVVHRDLKPSNIMVTDDGQVKLLDFGIAKMLSDEEEDEPLTRTGGAVMTPAYASPEQARGEPISTASDIYSLGVILYELLTGLRPYDVDAKNPLEAARMICEVEPERPSTAVAETGGSDTTTHGSDTGRLRRLLSGDLDVICLKALRKEPERRYTTSDELGDDIRRHLKGRPIEARAESVSYRIGKFVRRHRMGVGLTAAVILLIGGLIGFYTAQLSAERDRAQSEAEKAMQVSDFLKQVFRVSNPTQGGGEALTAREVLDEGAERLETELADQPEVLAEMTHVIAEVYAGLGLYEESLELHLRGLEIREQELEPPHAGLAASLNFVGNGYRRVSEYVRADSMYTLSLLMHKKIASGRDKDAVEILNNMGLTADGLGDLTRAESLHTLSLEIRREIVYDDELLLGPALNNLAKVKSRLVKYDEADSLYRETIELLRREHGDRHINLAITMRNRASTQRYMGNTETADSLYRASIAMRRAVLEPGHTSIGLALNSYAGFLRSLGKYDSAEVMLREAYDIQMASVGPEHSRSVSVLDQLSKLYVETGRYEQADSLRRLALDFNLRNFGEVHPRIASDLGYLAEIQFEHGNLEEAADYRRRALSIRKQVYPVGHPRIARDLHGLGEVYIAMGRTEEARVLLEQALIIRLEAYGEDHEAVAETRSLLKSI